MATTMGLPASGISSPWQNWYNYMGGQQQATAPAPITPTPGAWSAQLGQVQPASLGGAPSPTQTSEPSMAAVNRPAVMGGNIPTPSPISVSNAQALQPTNTAQTLERMVQGTSVGKPGGQVTLPTTGAVTTPTATAAGGLSDLLQNLQPVVQPSVTPSALGATTTPPAQVPERVTTGAGGTTEMAAGAGTTTYTPPVYNDPTTGKPVYIDYAAYHKWAATQSGWKKMDPTINKILKDYWTNNILPLKEGGTTPPGEKRNYMSKDDDKTWKTWFQTNYATGFTSDNVISLFKIWADPEVKMDAYKTRFKAIFDSILGQFALGKGDAPDRATVSAAISKYIDGELARSNAPSGQYFLDATQKEFVDSMTDAMMMAIDSYSYTAPEAEDEDDKTRRTNRYNELLALYNAKDKAGIYRLIASDPEYQELYDILLKAMETEETEEPVDLTPEQITTIVKQIQDALARGDNATIVGLLLQYPQIKDNWDIIQTLLFPTNTTTTGYVPPANWWEQGWSGGESPYSSQYGSYAGLI